VAGLGGRVLLLDDDKDGPFFFEPTFTTTNRTVSPLFILENVRLDLDLALVVAVEKDEEGNKEEYTSVVVVVAEAKKLGALCLPVLGLTLDVLAKRAIVGSEPGAPVEVILVLVVVDEPRTRL
jgi:hypothetical protein